MSLAGTPGPDDVLKRVGTPPGALSYNQVLENCRSVMKCRQENVVY